MEKEGGKIINLQKERWKRSFESRFRPLVGFFNDDIEFNKMLVEEIKLAQEEIVVPKSSIMKFLERRIGKEQETNTKILQLNARIDESSTAILQMKAGSSEKAQELLYKEVRDVISAYEALVFRDPVKARALHERAVYVNGLLALTNLELSEVIRKKLESQ